MRRGRAGRLGLALSLAAALATAMPAAGAGPELAEGNRRYRGGDLEGALALYASGYDPAHPDPLLAYNLGATAHRLGRLPEALLWYRRAEAHAPLALLPGGGDPWLADNLALARRELGAPRVFPQGWALLAARRDVLLLAGCLLAWAAVLVLVVEPAAGRRLRTAPAIPIVRIGRIVRTVRTLRIVRIGALGLALAGAALYGAAWLLAARGPREAVLLAPCGDLPAGSEVWVRRAGAGGPTLLAGAPGPPCPAEVLGLVAP